MDNRVIEWLKSNVGRTFSSPRKAAFGGSPYDLMISNVDVQAEEVKIKFIGSKYDAQPLHFWMFNRIFQYLREKRDKFVWLGTKLQPPYYPDTVEGKIWKKPYPTGKTSYKASPHVCDIITLAGLAEYGYAVNPKTRRRVQGVRLLEGSRKAPMENV